MKGPAATILDTMYSYLTSFMPISIDSIFTSLDSALSIGSSNNPFTCFDFFGPLCPLWLLRKFLILLLCVFKFTSICFKCSFSSLVYK